MAPRAGMTSPHRPEPTIPSPKKSAAGTGRGTTHARHRSGRLGATARAFNRLIPRVHSLHPVSFHNAGHALAACTRAHPVPERNLPPLARSGAGHTSALRRRVRWVYHRTPPWPAPSRHPSASAPDPRSAGARRVDLSPHGGVPAPTRAQRTGSSRDACPQGRDLPLPGRVGDRVRSVPVPGYGGSLPGKRSPTSTRDGTLHS